MCVHEGKREKTISLIRRAATETALQCAVEPQGPERRKRESDPRYKTCDRPSSSKHSAQIGYFCVVHFTGKYEHLTSLGDIIYETTVRKITRTKSPPSDDCIGPGRGMRRHQDGAYRERPGSGHPQRRSAHPLPHQLCVAAQRQLPQLLQVRHGGSEDHVPRGVQVSGFSVQCRLHLMRFE